MDTSSMNTTLAPLHLLVWGNFMPLTRCPASPLARPHPANLCRVVPLGSA